MRTQTYFVLSLLTLSTISIVGCSKGDKRSLPATPEGPPPITQNDAGAFDFGGKVRTVDLKCVNSVTTLDPRTRKPIVTQFKTGGQVIRPGYDDGDDFGGKPTPFSAGTYTMSWKVTDRSMSPGPNPRVKNVAVRGKIAINLTRGGGRIQPLTFMMSLAPRQRTFSEKHIVLSNDAEFMDVDCRLDVPDDGPGPDSDRIANR